MNSPRRLANKRITVFFPFARWRWQHGLSIGMSLSAVDHQLPSNRPHCFAADTLRDPVTLTFNLLYSDQWSFVAVQIMWSVNITRDQRISIRGQIVAEKLWAGVKIVASRSWQSLQRVVTFLTPAQNFLTTMRRFINSLQVSSLTFDLRPLTMTLTLMYDLDLHQRPWRMTLTFNYNLDLNLTDLDFNVWHWLSILWP